MQTSSPGILFSYLKADWPRLNRRSPFLSVSGSQQLCTTIFVSKSVAYRVDPDDVPNTGGTSLATDSPYFERDMTAREAATALAGIRRRFSHRETPYDGLGENSIRPSFSRAEKLHIVTAADRRQTGDEHEQPDRRVPNEENPSGISNDDLIQWSDTGICSKCDAFIIGCSGDPQEAVVPGRLLNFRLPVVSHSEIRRRREAADQVTLPLRWMQVVIRCWSDCRRAAFMQRPNIFLDPQSDGPYCTHFAAIGMLIALRKRRDAACHVCNCV